MRSPCALDDLRPSRARAGPPERVERRTAAAPMADDPGLTDVRTQVRAEDDRPQPNTPATEAGPVRSPRSPAARCCPRPADDRRASSREGQDASFPPDLIQPAIIASPPAPGRRARDAPAATPQYPRKRVRSPTRIARGRDERQPERHDDAGHLVAESRDRQAVGAVDELHGLVGQRLAAETLGVLHGDQFVGDALEGDEPHDRGDHRRRA